MRERIQMRGAAGKARRKLSQSEQSRKNKDACRRSKRDERGNAARRKRTASIRLCGCLQPASEDAPHARDEAHLKCQLHARVVRGAITWITSANGALTARVIRPSRRSDRRCGRSRGSREWRRSPDARRRARPKWLRRRRRARGWACCRRCRSRGTSCR